MKRVHLAAFSRLAAVDPVQTCYSLYSRIGLSSQATTSAEPETIEALLREDTGRHTSNRFRKVRIHGRRGLLAQRYHIKLGDEQLPVLPRVVHINSVSNVVENITFMHCPPGRKITVPIPVEVIGEDACPGVKQNGFPYLIRRSVECLCPGDAIPAAIEVDVSGLNLGQTVLLPQLKLPEGVQVVAPHPTLPVCKIAGKGSREG
ncbi:MAG: 50S ribosomal [Trebouxia sp. A1-2]|nr:MAG: 50S ribosomal [Trebouxia sp. A1-2]